MIKSIPSEELLLENSPFIIDVRETDEYLQGHIPKVLHIPLHDLPTRLRELEKEQTYYLICHSGVRSQVGCEFLQSQNYQAVNIIGGMTHWKGEISYG